MSTPPMLDLHAARMRDEQHPLAGFRERFVAADSRLIYLDGNSLGPPPRETRDHLEHVLDHEWGERLIRSWNEGWIDAPERLGDMMAPLVGAAPGQVTFSDSTSVNLFKLALAALARQAPRRKILTDALNFPSDVYVLEGMTRLHPDARLFVVAGAVDGIGGDEDALIDAIDDDTALVVLSHVTFKSGFRYDAARVTAAAHARGAMVLWDLSHSVGSVRIELDAWGADLAIGCGYKYLNGGPGAPAFLYVKESLQAELLSPIWGWFGQRDPFSFELEYRPVDGIRRFAVGTPPMLSLLALQPAIEILLDAGMERVTAASEALSTYLIELFDARLTALGFRLASPRAAQRRGSHVSLAHDEAYPICQAMIEANVIPDFRAPDSIRLGIAPLYVRHEDLWNAVDRMADIVERSVHLGFSAARAAVT